MPKINKQNQMKRNSEHTKEDMHKILQPIKARDNIKAAFAGSENKGPIQNKKTKRPHSTNVKSRNTDESRTRTPIR